MTQAFALRMPRGISGTGLAILVAVFLTSTAMAQSPPASKGEAAKPRPEEKKPELKQEADVPAPVAESFLDPNAKRTLLIFAPLIYSGPPIKIANAGGDASKIQSMTSRASNLDPDLLKRYIEFFAVELTKRENLNAVINPNPAVKLPEGQNRFLERAVNALTKPLLDARANNNSEFLITYTRLLFESSLPKILENNYLSRIDAMIVLGMAGSNSQAALDLYIAQINKPGQVIWVKLWAARGLSNAAQSGAVDLDAAKANLAAEALVTFLDSDPKMPWPAQMRALEALGSIRVAAVNSPRKVDVASVALRYLADPEAKPEVRAWAAWALGMIKVPTNLAPYNYNLLGHEIGGLAIDLGSKIVQEFDHDPANFDREKDMAAHFTGLLLFQVYPSLIGEENVRESGLLRSPHPSATSGTAKPFIAKLDEKIKAISRESYELLRAGGAAGKVKRNDLDAKIADLKIYLGQTTLKDRHLVPGGPEFPPNPAPQVVGAPGP